MDNAMPTHACLIMSVVHICKQKMLSQLPYIDRALVLHVVLLELDPIQ